MGGRLRSAGLALLAACATACAGGAPAGAPAPGGAEGGLLYVASQEAASVTVLDMATGDPVETVDLTRLGYSATAKAHDVAVEPDGSFWYVSLIAEGKVVKFDRTNRVVGEAAFETPGMLALDPDGDLLYVGRSMAAVSPPQRVGVIRRSTMDIDEIDVFFPRPHAITLDPVGGRVFVSSMSDNRVAWAAVGEEEVELADLPGPHHMVVQLAVSPDGRWMVGTGQMSGELLVWDLGGHEPVVVERVAIGGQPWHPSFTPDGAEVWVPTQENNGVAVVRTSDWTVVDRIQHVAFAEPHGSVVSPDGRRVFVSGQNVRTGFGGGDDGTVVVIDRATREVVHVVQIGAYGAGMARAAGVR